MARPFEKPLVTAGKFTYTRLGNRLVVFPSDCVQKDEEQLITAINHAWDRNTMQILTTEQHNRLKKLLEHHQIIMWR